jgi:6,7-dimethyl-8-ribityllumazine synthase
MSGSVPQIEIRKLPAAKVMIISSSWHLDICNDLIAGAQRAIEKLQWLQ